MVLTTRDAFQRDFDPTPVFWEASPFPASEFRLDINVKLKQMIFKNFTPDRKNFTLCLNEVIQKAMSGYRQLDNRQYFVNGKYSRFGGGVAFLND